MIAASATIVCALLALATLPPRAQIVLGLAAVAAIVWGQSSSPGTPGTPGTTANRIERVRGVIARVAIPAPPDAADRFDDAKAAITVVSEACAQFDAFKAGELAAVLDECMFEYMKVLTRSGVVAAAALSSHMSLRETVRSTLSEAHVASDAAASTAIDAAAARLDALFAACDVVMLRDGKAQTPAPAGV